MGNRNELVLGGRKSKVDRTRMVEEIIKNATPAARLRKVHARLASYMEIAPAGINREALQRYIETMNPADQAAVLTDSTNENQVNFLATIDTELDRKFSLKRQIATGVELIAAPDPVAEELLARQKALVRRAVKAGADRHTAWNFLMTREGSELVALEIDFERRGDPDGPACLRDMLAMARESILGKPPVVIQGEVVPGQALLTSSEE